MKQYYKLLMALFSAALVGVKGALLGDNHVSVEEGIMIASSVLLAFQVWQTTNGPVGTYWNYAKSVVAGGLAVFSVIVGYLSDGIDGAEGTSLIIIFLTAAGVLVVTGPALPRGTAAPAVVSRQRLG
jgi:hypothetical protein